MASDEKFQIILDKVPYERQAEAALFLSGCFSLPPASTKGIAASGPIALLNGLPREQAAAVLEELKASVPEGVELRMSGETEASKLSRLQWPRPPRIYGRNLSEFEERQESGELACPLCGGLVRITHEGQEVHLLPVVETSRKNETSRRMLSASDKDPLFSGVKPLATADSDFASLRSLEAGDTGFWMDYSNNVFSAPPLPEPPAARTPGRESTTLVKKNTGRMSAGLSAFMKPGGFAVVVGRTKDPQVVKMISEIMGVKEDEAREKGLSLGLCIARDISLDEAQNLLARFRNLGAKARIVRPA